jgi:TolB-like protein
MAEKTSLIVRTVQMLFVATCCSIFAQENIAVMELEAKNISRQDAGVLTDKLRSEIIKTRKFNVMERDRMNEILKEQGFQQSGVCSSDECAVRAGNIIGVSRMVAGSVGRLSESFLVTVRMIDVETGKIVRNVDETIKGGIDMVLETGMAAVAQKLMTARDMGTKQTAKPNHVPGNFGPSDGLLGFWPMDKIDGNSLTDLSGNGKNGSIFGAKVDIKGGMKFSGSGDYLSFGELPASREFTASFWVKPVGIADQIWYDALCGNAGNDLGGGVGFIVMSNELHFLAGPACNAPKPSSDIVYSMDNIEPGKWHHIAGTLAAGKSMALFVDGKEIKRTASGVPRGIPDVTAQFFGADSRKPEIQTYCGKARDMLVFDRALEAAEVSALYSAGKSR